MLLQHNQRNQLLLFPALPRDWDVSFKLHGPGGTVVSAKCVNNTVVQLEVVPASRRSDVVVVGCGGTVGTADAGASIDADAGTGKGNAGSSLGGGRGDSSTRAAVAGEDDACVTMPHT